VDKGEYSSNCKIVSTELLPLMARHSLRPTLPYLANL